MKKETVFIFIIIFLALILRLVGINHGLPDINRFFWETDEAATINIAMGMGSGDFNPYSFNKPSLTYYLTFICYAVFYLAARLFNLFSSPFDFAIYYFKDTFWFYIIARALSLVFGLLTIYMTYRVGKRAFGEKTGLLAAALLTIIPLHITYSRLALPDIQALLFMLLAVYFIIPLLERDATKDYILAGLFAGLAATTKYHFGLIWLLVPGVFIYNLTKGKNNVKGILSSCLFFGIGFVLGTPFSVIDFPRFLSGLTALKAAKNIAVPFIPNWWIEHIRQLWDYRNLGAVLLILSLLALGYAIFKRSKAALLLVVSVFIFYSFFSFPTIAWSPVHYLLPLMPFLAILVSFFILSQLKQRHALYISLAIIFIPVLLFDITNSATLSRRDTKYYARQWIEKNIPKGSKLLTECLYGPQLTLTGDSYARLNDSSDNDKTLLPSRANVLNIKSGKKELLKAEKFKSLTEGVAYNIYPIFDKALFSQKNNISVRDFVKKYGIEYLIINSESKATYLEGNLFSQYKGQFNSFYDSLPANTVKLSEFSPEAWKTLGPSIAVLKIIKEAKQ